MSIILSHSEVLLGPNHRNVSMHIGFCTSKICIETQFKFLWFWPSNTSLWDSMMLILAAREILYSGLRCLKSISWMERLEGTFTVVHWSLCGCNPPVSYPFQ